jgi:HlyD family secretion protein
MDRPISNTEQRKNNLAKWLKYAAVVGVIILGFFGLRYALKTKVEKSDFVFATVERGDVENAITATGLVVPSFEQQINAPINTEIKNVVLKSGAKVKTGDLIMNLDEEFIKLEYEGLQDQLELKKNNITRLGLEYDKNLKDLDYQNQIMALQIANLEANLSDRKRLQKVGGATEEDVEKATLNLKIQKLEKQKLENDLNFRKQAVTSDKRNLELEVMIQQKKLRELNRKLNETAVKAPTNGVITWLSEDIGKKVLEGEPLVRLANLGNFRIEASCSDRYSNLVKVGMSVNVRINQTILKGEISSILPAVENNTIGFTVALENANSVQLRPNMKVEVFIISGKKENVLRLKNGAAFTGAIQQNLFVVRGNEAVKVAVNVGLTSVDYVEILTNELKVGDKVIVSSMTDFEYMDRIELK